MWAETEGNPFFVAEVLRHLTETGGVEHREGRWVTTVPVAELGIPEGVRDVVGRRLSRLSDAANRALAVASVLGLEFEPAVLRAAGDLGEEALFAALEEAVGARLLAEVPGARYRFAHALVRATLYDEMLATVLGRFPEAEGHFAAAEATHARIGAPVWLARSRLEWARMLRGLGGFSLTPWPQPGNSDWRKSSTTPVPSSSEPMTVG